MRSGAPQANIGRVSTEDSERIILELERGEPIRGIVRDDGGEERTFHGWIARARAQRAPDERNARAPI
jgi:hypothetical protein